MKREWGRLPERRQRRAIIAAAVISFFELFLPVVGVFAVLAEVVLV